MKYQQKQLFVTSLLYFFHEHMHFDFTIISLAERMPKFLFILT